MQLTSFSGEINYLAYGYVLRLRVVQESESAVAIYVGSACLRRDAGNSSARRRLFLMTNHLHDAVHVHEVHAHEVHSHEVHSHEGHAHEVHAHEVHAHEVSNYAISNLEGLTLAVSIDR